MALKTVEDTMNTLKDWGWSTDAGKEAFTHAQFKQVQITISLDRQATLTALVTALEGMRKSRLNVGFMEDSYIYTHNQALDQAITLVKELL